MTYSVSSYLSNIPSTDPLSPLASLIQSKITIANSSTNVVGANAAKAELPSLLAQFVGALMDRKKISPATILALTVAAAATGGHALADVGINGSVSVSGSAISITAGTY